ncbi:SDR family NAD(P)-dependent oxidoreductase [Oricola cellulosilytica]|uniref:SDR family oxidoreductase n=1 Tax=Oricola cellulosilytica TaxID=1429082 RepID=A0A4R0PHS2_9HYPH|nr:SDR family oxidoreductase [Oricola cellulosilytica]TCD16324.1 SDR family oxidoreductase [Oricola cellulosilytica]
MTIFNDLRDASVLITGGGTGIGAALTEGFVAQGAKVAFVDILEDDSTALVERLAPSAVHRPLFLKTDLRDIAALKEAASKAARAHGPVTVLVNNAAWDDRHEIGAVDEAYWENNLAINLRPQFFMAQAVAPGMKAAGGGTIVNFTSTSYMLNIGDMPAYTAAKAGIVGLTKALAGKLGTDNIRVNAIAPGWVMTGRQKELWVTEEGLNAMLARQCIKAPIQPEHMVGPCLFLASGASAMITAQTLIADGGML